MDAVLPQPGASCTKQLGKHWTVVTLSVLLSSLVILFLHGAFLRDYGGCPYAFTLLSGAGGADTEVLRSDNHGNSTHEAVHPSALHKQGHPEPEVGNPLGFEASAEGNQSEAVAKVAHEEGLVSATEQRGSLVEDGVESDSIGKSTRENGSTVASKKAEETAGSQRQRPPDGDNDNLIGAKVDESAAAEEAAQNVAVQSASQRGGVLRDKRDHPVESGATTERDQIVAGLESKRRPSLCIFSVHRWDANLENEFEHLVSDVGPELAVLLFDETYERYSGKWQNTFRLKDGPFAYRARAKKGADLGPLVLLTNSDELRAGSKIFNDGWATVHGKLVLVYRAILVSTSFEYVWIIESDVRCKGSYKRTFEKADGLSHDILGRDLRVYGEDTKDWPHWEELEGPVEMSKRVSLFLPVMRLSRFAFEILSTADYDGTIKGFQETYIPTVLSTYGGTCGELPENMLGYYEFRPKLSNAEYGHLSTSPGAVDVFFHPVVDG